MIMLKKSLLLSLAVSLTLASCAKRGYEQRMANRDSVPLYTSPATVGGGSIGSPAMPSSSMPAITSTPISSSPMMAPVANNAPTPITTMVGGVPASYESTASITPNNAIPSMPAISSQEAARQFAPQPASTSTQYIVQPGDTVYAIGRKFNVHPNEIIRSNPAVNHSSLSVGQTIVVPSSNVAYPGQTQAMTNAQHQLAMTQAKPSNVMTDAQGNNNLLSQVRASRGEDAVMGTNTASATTNKNVYFKMPSGGKIIQKYDAGNSSGIRVVVPNGTNVTAAAGGDVLYVGNVEGYGQMVLIRHANGYVSNYAGLEKIYVKQGDKLSAGDSIARVSGSGDKSQMMYELRDGTKTIDPSKFIG